MDFNTPIDITKLSSMPLDLVDDTPFDNSPVPKREKAARAAKPAWAGTPVGQVTVTEPQKPEKPKAPKKPKSKTQRPGQAVIDKEKDYIPTYKPKPVTKIKRLATSGSFKKGDPRVSEALNEEDKEFIAENARKMSVDEIADTRGKRRITVYNYMEKHGLLGEDDKRDQRIKRAILNNLHNQAFWYVIRDGYSPEEIRYFEEEWCAFTIQLDDNVTATEQMQLKQLIENQISIDRLTIREQKALGEIEQNDREMQKLQDEIWKGVDDTEVNILTSKIAALTSANSGLVSSKQSFERIKGDLVKAQSKIMQDLDVTRTKRVEKSDFSDRTWSKMLMEIKENPRIKKQMGAMGFVSFLAVERMRGKLTQDYTYANGDVHSPLLLPEGTVNTELTAMVEALYVPHVEEE